MAISATVAREHARRTARVSTSEMHSASGGSPVSEETASERDGSSRSRVSATREFAASEEELRDRVTDVGHAGPVALATDVELLRRFEAGEEAAFAELYSRHRQQIYAYCLRMLGGDSDRASDVFQEVFIRMYEKASLFREGSNVTGWLLMIARNTCFNSFRAKRPTDPLDNHEYLTSSDRSLAPEFEESQHFMRAKLEQAIAKLPVDYREPFVLREFDGFGYTEIAESLGLTVGVTKTRIYRAKQKLRELLHPYLSEDDYE